MGWNLNVSIKLVNMDPFEASLAPMDSWEWELSIGTKLFSNGARLTYILIRKYQPFILGVIEHLITARQVIHTADIRLIEF